MGLKWKWGSGIQFQKVVLHLVYFILFVSVNPYNVEEKKGEKNEKIAAFYMYKYINT